MDVRYAIPPPTVSLEKLDLAEIDPKRVLYNALVPFAVALLESFFSRCFKILLHCDPEADERIAKQSKKVELNDVIAIKNGTRTIEDIVAEWYSFQNIDSIHRAFSDWFGINFRAIIREPKKSGNKIRLLEHQLNYIIDFRHGIVHRMEVDSQLTKSQVDDIFAAALSIIDAFVSPSKRREELPSGTPVLNCERTIRAVPPVQ